MGLHIRLIILIIHLVSLAFTSINATLSDKISYRIRSGYDGNMLTAHPPSFTKEWKLKLGNVTTQAWNEDSNQLWRIYSRFNVSNSNNSDLYWMRPNSNVLNFLTGTGEHELTLDIREVVPQSGTFTIRNSKSKLCVENMGLGLPVTYKPCNEFNVAQQWDFEDPLNLKIIRLFHQILNMYN